MAEPELITFRPRAVHPPHSGQSHYSGSASRSAVKCLPERVIPAQHQTMQRQMLLRVWLSLMPVYIQYGLSSTFPSAPPNDRRCRVRTYWCENGVEPPRAALLNGDRLTRYRSVVSRGPHHPLRFSTGSSSCGTSDRFFLHRQPAAVPREYLQNIQAGHFSDGKGAGMGFLHISSQSQVI